MCRARQDGFCLIFGCFNIVRDSISKISSFRVNFQGEFMDFRQILFFNIKPIEANELNCILLKWSILLLILGRIEILINSLKRASYYEWNSVEISSLSEKCPYSEIFWSAFSRIRTEYGEILRISSYSVRMRENTDQKNSEYGHFLRSAYYMIVSWKVTELTIIQLHREICFVMRS